MLGRLEINIDKYIAVYSNLASAVFSKKLSCIPVNIKGKIKLQFDLAKLESTIQEAVAKNSISETELLNNRTEYRYRT